MRWKARSRTHSRGNPAPRKPALLLHRTAIPTRPPPRFVANPIPACGRRWEIWTPPRHPPPVLQHPHNPGHPFSKSRTTLPPLWDAVLPRIPTSPQPTTTTAIYTYPLIYSVVAVARRPGEKRPAAPFTLAIPMSPPVSSQNGAVGAPASMANCLNPLKSTQLSTPLLPVHWCSSDSCPPTAALV